ncbi:MAG: DEAD/DEAH box helicase family protein [Pseudomonadota bacterium]|nr:DEAD/DEAH box helicase family protein [Pseudomonadota bacterium]
MSQHVNAISGRLSLRPPQRVSLERLHRVMEIAHPRHGLDMDAALEVIKSEYPTVTDFERAFPSLCFALATGVGKTRLMGAFISYLHLEHGICNFFVLAPNLTIYNKLIADFTENTPKYVFKGIHAFAAEPPQVITGDNYEQRDPRSGRLFGQVQINIFNIAKISSEVRGGRSPRIRRLSEYIGESYFDYLSGLDDLVMLMDESHRYRASAGMRAINELKPILGLELTATPFVETSRGPVQFRNVIYDYPLARAMADGFVKEPAVVTQKDFDPSRFSQPQLEQVKLEDGLRLHERLKVELETYARQNDVQIVKPFVLVIARDTTHAAQLLELIESDVFEGRYNGKVIQVDSSKKGTAAEEAMVTRLLAVESRDEPTEIVIHVNMLKEGWDVTNLYTIVPLRAANARILIEQSIGRGLRLPYGKRTGISAVDRLNIVAHDRFQEIINEANRADSVIRLQQVILDPERDLKPTHTVVAQSDVERELGLGDQTAGKPAAEPGTAAVFKTDVERKVAQTTYRVIKQFQHLPSSQRLKDKDIAGEIVKKVEEETGTYQPELAGLEEAPSIAEIVAKTTELVVARTIDIPRILVVPKGEVTLGFNPFQLDLSAVNFQPVDRDLLIQHLRTNQQERISASGSIAAERRLEDYLVRGLIDFDDISYDEHADLLYDLAGQVVSHLRGYLDEDDTRNVLQYYERQLVELTHTQMQDHQWEGQTDYEVKVSKGFTELKESAFTAPEGDVRNFRQTVEDKSKIAQYVFGGFAKSLYAATKFDSDSERLFSVVLESDRDVDKWIRPAKGQFQLFYKSGVDYKEYQPDFVVETRAAIYMCEPKQRKELQDPEVSAKKEAAEQWCRNATAHTATYGGKPWKYALIPHDTIATNMSLQRLAAA